MNLDDLLQAIENGRPPTTDTVNASEMTIVTVPWIEFACLQSQLLFMYRMVIENNLPLPDETRQHLLKLHDDTIRVWGKLNK